MKTENTNWVLHKRPHPVYDLKNQSGRVKYAESVIRRGGSTSRLFDTCFEMGDGDEVVALLVKSAKHCEALERNLPKYISAESLAKAKGEA